MKKLLFVLAFVAVYGISMAKTTAPVVSTNQTVVVADEGKDNVEKDKKEAKTEAKKEAKAESKSAGCGGATETKAEAAKSHDCGGEAKAEAAKSHDCGGEKKTAEAKTGGNN